jgi:hypothetical protein
VVVSGAPESAGRVVVVVDRAAGGLTAQNDALQVAALTGEVSSVTTSSSECVRANCGSLTLTAVLTAVCLPCRDCTVGAGTNTEMSG